MSRPRDRLSPCERSRTRAVRPQVASYRAGARLPGARDVSRGGRRHLATVSPLHLHPQSLSSENTGQRMGGAPSMLSTPSTSPFCGPRTRTTMGTIPSRIARTTLREGPLEIVVLAVPRVGLLRRDAKHHRSALSGASQGPRLPASLVPRNLRGTFLRTFAQLSSFP